MEGYLGEVDISDQFDISPTKGALMYVKMYGGIDGSHHKDWVLDQTARILLGTKVIVTRASWSNGQTELRYNLDEPTEAYNEWVKSVRYNKDGEDCGYEIGIAP